MIISYDDIAYTVVVSPTTHYVEFKVYDWEAVNRDGKWEPIISDDTHLILDGAIKFDGCSNWNMMPDGVCLHLCGRDGLRDFTTLMNRLYDKAKELMPSSVYLDD